MRKGLILISPTWFLVGTLVYGIHLKTMNSVAGTSWVAFSLVGLGAMHFYYSSSVVLPRLPIVRNILRSVKNGFMVI